MISADNPSRIPVRKLAAVTLLAAVTALALPHVGQRGDGANAPVAAVLGQNIWNAAEVGFLLLLLFLWCFHRKAWVALLGATSLAILPFAIYVTSPGAWAVAFLLSLACLLAWRIPDLSVRLVDAPARGTPVVAKFAFLAFLCNLGSSLYNFNASKNFWPHWYGIFSRITDIAGFSVSQESIAETMYSLGLKGIGLPAYIMAGSPTNNLGSIVFAVLWTLLPALYALYFLALAKTARGTPGALLQCILCFYAVFHFLFLTDIVDYRFGRGFTNPYAELAHWSERIVWRYAILIPLWQKITTGGWRRANGLVGVALHYLAVFWAAGFITYQLIFFDAPNIWHLLFGGDFTPYRLFGVFPRVFRYYGILNLMLLAYGITMFAFRCKRFRVSPVSR